MGGRVDAGEGRLGRRRLARGERGRKPRRELEAAEEKGN